MFRSYFHLLSFLAFAMTGIPWVDQDMDLHAQEGERADTLLLADEVVCEHCRLELEVIATLGADDGPALLYDHMAENVVRDSGGAYWLWTHDIPTQLIRFRDERSVEVFGRVGGGPGEYRRIRHVFALTDGRIGVLDAGNQRISYLSQSGTFLESVPHNGPTRYLGGVHEFDENTLLISAIGVRGQQLGVPLHKIDRESGRVLESFGPVPGVYDTQVAIYGGREMAAGKSAVYLAHRYEYVIDVLSLAGAPIKTLVRNAPWFRPVDILSHDLLQDGPYSALLDVADGGNGVLLVLLQKAAPTWREGFGERGHEGAPSIETKALLVETVIEALDLESGEVLAREVHSGAPLSFVASGTQVAILDDNGKTPRVMILSVDLERLSTTHRKEER